MKHAVAIEALRQNVGFVLGDNERLGQEINSLVERLGRAQERRTKNDKELTELLLSLAELERADEPEAAA